MSTVSGVLRSGIYAVISIFAAVNAAAATGSASGYGLNADISVTPPLLPQVVLINAQAPNPAANVTATGSDSQTTVGVNILSALLNSPVLSTGVLTGTANARLAGFSTDKVGATGGTDHSAVNVGLLSVVNVLSLSTGVIQANANATCVGGAPQLSGYSNIANLNLNVLNNPGLTLVNATVDASTPANDVLANVTLNVVNAVTGTVKVVANEQNTTAGTLTVNALHVQVNVDLGLAIAQTNVSLDVVIGHATAQMTSACAALPALALNASPNPFLRLGTGTYTATVTSNGVTPVAGPLTIIETLPAGLTFAGNVVGSGWSCSGSQIVTCSNSSSLGAAPAQSSVSFDANIGAGAANSVTNNATFAAANVPNCATSPSVFGCANINASVTTNVVGAPKVTATKSASASPLLVGVGGQSYAIAVTIANGPTTAPVTVADSLPTGITLSGAPAVSGGATLSGCNSSGNSLGASCQLAAGLANGTYTITVPITVAAGAVGAQGGNNKANLGGGGDPGCTAANSNETCDPSTPDVPVTTPSNLTVTKGAPTIANVGGNQYTATYQIDVTNSGGVNGTYTLTDTPAFPAGVTLTGISVSGSGGASPIANPPSMAAPIQISTSNVSIAGGNTTHTYMVVLKFVLGPSATTNLTCSPGNPNHGAFNTASITDGTGATIGSNSNCGDLPSAPSLSVTKTNDSGTVKQGGTTSYTVTLTNNGNADATGVSWTDDVGGGLTVTGITAGATSGATTNSGTCATQAPWGCSGITVAANGSVSYSVTADVTGAPGTDAVNNANIGGGGCTAGTPSTPANCSSTDTHPVIAVPDLMPTFTYDDVSYTVGGATDGTREVIINIMENNNVATTGQIQFYVPDSAGFTYLFGTGAGWTASSLVTPSLCANLNNADWTVTTQGAGTLFTSNVPIPAGGQSCVLIKSQADIAGTDADITVTIAPGSGGEVRTNNDSAVLSQSIQR